MAEIKLNTLWPKRNVKAAGSAEKTLVAMLDADGLRQKHGCRSREAPARLL